MAENTLGNYLWYKYSFIVNQLHPMILGFHRKKVLKNEDHFLEEMQMNSLNISSYVSLKYL